MYFTSAGTPMSLKCLFTCDTTHFKVPEIVQNSKLSKFAIEHRSTAILNHSIVINHKLYFGGFYLSDPELLTTKHNTTTVSRWSLCHIKHAFSCKRGHSVVFIRKDAIDEERFV